MTVEDQRNENDVSSDQFPVGMRVLAVDDDPICLKVLESLLRKCRYEVITANQAMKALKMLRENRNMVDLVISDVNMPDMDGFKLLELVGLEMDLPVIMLSAHSDTKLVMKGINHGACDYLLKPVRIEELKNIWQHVHRRKKLDHKNQSKSTGNDKAASIETGEGGDGAGSVGNLDQNSSFNRKRKDQNEDDEENSDDDGRENEDPANQKKPRIVWSADLHKKFVDAVKQLGIEKAFPKKILDLMNVEGLTRENVASHLQKFRQYLKKVDFAKSQNASGAFGVKDFSYMRMGALNQDFGDLRSMSLPIRLANSALSPSVSHVGMLGRLNSPSGLSMRGITQPTNSHNLSNSFNTSGKFQPSLLANQTSSLFQGFPSSLELNQFQLPQTKSSNPLGELNALNASPTSFSALTGFQATKATSAGSNDWSVPMSNSSSSPLTLQGNSQPTLSKGFSGIQSSVRPAASNTQSGVLGISGSCNFLDHNRCNEPWQSAVQSSMFPSTALPMTEPSNHAQVHTNNLIIPSTISQFGTQGFSSSSALSVPQADSRGDIQGRDGLIGNMVPTNNLIPRQPWEGGFSNSHNLGQHFSAFNSLNQTMDQNNVGNKDSAMSIFDQLNGCSPSIFPSNEIEKSAIEETIMRPNEDNNLLSEGKTQDTLIPNYGSLDDILSSLMKRDQNETTIMNGDFGFDNYPLGSCM